MHFPPLFHALVPLFLCRDSFFIVNSCSLFVQSVYNPCLCHFTQNESFSNPFKREAPPLDRKKVKVATAAEQWLTTHAWLLNGHSSEKGSHGDDYPSSSFMRGFYHQLFKRMHVSFEKLEFFTIKIVGHLD